MPYDAVKMKDWQISEAAEKKMPTPEEWREKLGLQKDEMIPFGRLSRIDFLKVMKRMAKKPDGKYIEVTAITPTPLGEGKSTTSVGLMEGLDARNLSDEERIKRIPDILLTQVANLLEATKKTDNTGNS